ncbi:MAG TPA: OmpW family outer membrane protein [Thermoanaerobaculia bacterium]|jgi:outer membrane protein W
MKRNALIPSLILALALTAPGYAQQSHEVGIWVSQPVINRSNALEGLPLALDLDEQTGFGVGSRRTFSDRWALSLDAMSVKADATLDDAGTTVADLGPLSLTPIAAVAQFRLFRNVWVGAGAAYVITGDLSSADLDAAGIGDIQLDNEIAPVAAAGIDVPLSRRISLSFDARYMPLELRAKIAGDEEKSTITVDPLIVSAGIRVRL